MITSEVASDLINFLQDSSDYQYLTKVTKESTLLGMDPRIALINEDASIWETEPYVLANRFLVVLFVGAVLDKMKKASDGGREFGVAKWKLGGINVNSKTARLELTSRDTTVLSPIKQKYGKASPNITLVVSLDALCEAVSSDKLALPQMITGIRLAMEMQFCKTVAISVQGSPDFTDETTISIKNLATDYFTTVLDNFTQDALASI